MKNTLYNKNKLVKDDYWIKLIMYKWNISKKEAIAVLDKKLSEGYIVTDLDLQKMKKKYLHPVLNKEVDKEIYFNFVLSKDFPEGPPSEKMKQDF